MIVLEENRTMTKENIRIGDVVLEMKNVCKSFPGVKALDNMNLELRSGEVHVLLGENGAGKSTLIKILTGAYRADSGEVILKGNPVTINGPIHAQKLGISAVYQEFNLIPYLSVAENIFLGRELVKGKILNKKEMVKKAREVLNRIGAKIDVYAQLDSLGVAEQQLVEIAKALMTDAEILILDEPSAVLTDDEIDMLFNVINTLTAQGVAIIYISHRMDEISRIGNRATIMRDGLYITTVEISKNGMDMDYIIQQMVGRKIEKVQRRVSYNTGEELLRLENVSQKGVLNNINLYLNKGEIVGIAGLVGAGRTELAKAIFGDTKITSGKVFVKGREVRIVSPSDGIKNGIGLVPEDRKREGLVLNLPVNENVVMASLGKVSKKGVLNLGKIKAISNEMVDSLSIKTPSINQMVVNLSGGNQQKVVLAKWLAAETDIVIFDEPTRGIDIGAKQEVYELMEQLAQKGVGILMISSELPEVLQMSDRILVMHEGKLAGEVPAKDATQEKLLQLASGGTI